MAALAIPELPPDCDVLKAALRYAEAGWYVLPIDPAGKHAGSVLGRGWPEKSSRDPAQIAAWFAGASWGLALHVGRSGAVAFDVDHPSLVPDALAVALERGGAPYQSTRAGERRRGHYVFAAPAGTIGNSGGELGTAWGEVRGLNGIIVVEPTRHEHAAEGGRYEWVVRGPVPALPVELAVMLRPPGGGGAGENAVDNAGMLAFLEALPVGEPCPAVRAVSASMPPSGRHATMSERALRLVRLGEQGHVGARARLIELGNAFVIAVTPDRRGGEDEARGELRRAVTGAIAIITAAPTPGAERGCCGLGELPDVTFDPGVIEGEVIDGGAAVALDGDMAAALIARMLTPAQLRDRPGPTPLIAGLLSMDTCAWLIAEPGSYKSFVALDWAAHIAAGRAWMDRGVTRGPVVYVVAEGVAGMGPRIKAWEQRHGPMSNDLLILPMPVQIAKAEQWAALVEACRRLDPALIILDTQARITVGIDENDNSKMGEAIEAIERLRKACGACVLTVHHVGRGGQHARGASAIDGAQDTELRLTRTADRRAVLKIDKSKHSTDEERVELELFVCELDGGGTSLVVGPPLTAVPAAPWREGLAENQATIVDIMAELFSEAGGTKAEIAGALRERGQRGGPRYVRQSFHSAWNALLRADRIERIHGTQRFVLVDNKSATAIDDD